MAKSKKFLIYLLLLVCVDCSAFQSPIRQKVREIYSRQIGVREATGNNDGKSVEVYLKSVGLAKGNPWCAAYVCFCFTKAGVVNPRSGYSPALFPAKNVIYQPSKKIFGIPQTADVFGIWFANKGRIAHVGFVDRWGDKWTLTAEGNTNEAGSRDGDGAYRKKRLTRQIYAVSSFLQ